MITVDQVEKFIKEFSRQSEHTATMFLEDRGLYLADNDELNEVMRSLAVDYVNGACGANATDVIWDFARNMVQVMWDTHEEE